MKVIDAGVLVAAITTDDEPARELRRRLDGEVLAAPHLIDLEAANTFRRLVRGDRLALSHAQEALDVLRQLRIDRHPHGPLLRRCWELRDNVTPYDAAYVALAETLDVLLLTADARLARAPGIRCEVELLT